MPFKGVFEHYPFCFIFQNMKHSHLELYRNITGYIVFLGLWNQGTERGVPLSQVSSYFETVKLNHLKWYPSITRETKPRKTVSKYHVCCCFFSDCETELLTPVSGYQVFLLYFTDSETKPQNRYLSISCVVAFFQTVKRSYLHRYQSTSCFVVFYRQWNQAAKTVSKYHVCCCFFQIVKPSYLHRN